MHEIRKQLTLFIVEKKETIEEIRAEFNPVQYNLIPAHVTLCRDDELTSVEKVIENIRAIKLGKPLQIAFNTPERFENGNGVLIPVKPGNNAFNELRKQVLKDLDELPERHLAHITLMHPRNSTCTDQIFDQIKMYELPDALCFNKISLIEQRNGGRWIIIEEFDIV